MCVFTCHCPSHWPFLFSISKRVSNKMETSVLSEYDPSRMLHFSLFPWCFTAARLIALEWAGVLWEQVRSIKDMLQMGFSFEEAPASQLQCVSAEPELTDSLCYFFFLNLVVPVYFRNGGPYTHLPMESSIIRFHCFSRHGNCLLPFVGSAQPLFFCN